MDGSIGPSDERAGTRRLGSHRTDPPRRVGIDRGAHVLDRLNVIYKYRYAAVSLFLPRTQDDLAFNQSSEEVQEQLASAH